MNPRTAFEKVQNFDDDTTEYVALGQVSAEQVKILEEQILARYLESPDFKDKLEKLPGDNGSLNLKIKTEPESHIYTNTEKGTAFVVKCEDFDVKWHVANILQIALAMAGYEIKDTKF